MSVNGQPECGLSAPAWRPSIVSSVIINVSRAQAHGWFLSLADHPERYRFETHGGFAFTRGGIGEIGARFETVETFYGVRLRLRFEVTRVTQDRFCFSLRAPLSAIFGSFSLTPEGTSQTELQLAVGSPNRAKRLILSCPIIHGAIQHQISRETAHIKEAMETLYQEETWAS